MEYCFGVDIGGTTVKMGLFTIEGKLLEKWEIKTRTEQEGEAILPDVADSLNQKMEEKKLGKEQVSGIGIGIPAPVNAEGIVQNTANLGWGYKEVRKEMEDLTQMKVAVGNDANMAALGEMWLGAGKGEKNLIMVTLGTGVGGGVIVNGQPVVGAHGAGGEIGHIHIRDEETEKCNCGGIGCVEQIGSATGIAREARRKMAASDEPSSMRVFGDGITAKDVLDEAKKGDKMALEVVETVGRYLGMALAQLAMTVDPQMFVIGGGVSKAGQFLIDVITKYYNYYTPISENKAVIGLAKLGNDAGIYGAARLVLG